MSELAVGTSPDSSERVRYVEEVGDRGVGRTVDVYVAPREWDVMDSGERQRQAEAILGPITDENKAHAQWFVNEGRNAAGLAVYRPQKFSWNGVGQVA